MGSCRPWASLPLQQRVCLLGDVHRQCPWCISLTDMYLCSRWCCLCHDRLVMGCPVCMSQANHNPSLTAVLPLPDTFFPRTCINYPFIVLVQHIYHSTSTISIDPYRFRSLTWSGLSALETAVMGKGEATLLSRSKSTARFTCSCRP